MVYLIYVLYAVIQGLYATRLTAQSERNPMDNETLWALFILFVVVAPVVTAVVAYNVVKATVIFLVAGNK